MIKQYKIQKYLSKGKFNNVYLCNINNNNNLYIIKSENSSLKLLLHEYNIYKLIDKINITGKILEYFKKSNINYLVMEFCGVNMISFKRYNYKHLYYRNYIIFIIIKLINIINKLHSLNIIHRDIKPSNICIKNNDVYLIDFAFSVKYTYRNRHRDNISIHNIIGTPNYISENVCNKCTPSRRDDVESILFILVYLLMNKKQYKQYNNIDIYYKKEKVFLIDFFSYFTDSKDSVKILVNYIKNLEYTQEPDYNYLKKLIYLIFII